MRFKFKLEDIVAIMLLAVAAVVIAMACSYKLKDHQAQSTLSRTHHTPAIETPQIKPAARKTSAKQERVREAQAAQVFRIGIIDTGYDKSLDDQNLKICDKGSFDFGTGKPGVAHTLWHGTAVAQTIASELDDTNYCFVFYQVKGPLGITFENIEAAILRAAKDGLVAVNISIEESQYSFMEREALKVLTNRGTAVFVAAGNRHLNLDVACISYPGCYHIPNVYTVGAVEEDGRVITRYSNYGARVDVWKDGQIDFDGQTVQGTSFASPRALGDYVHSLSALSASK